MAQNETYEWAHFMPHKNRNKQWFKVISAGVICLCMGNQIVGASPGGFYFLRPEMALSKKDQRPSPVKIHTVHRKTKIKQDILKGVDVKKKKTIVIYGGLGSLQERFLGPGFRELEGIFNVDFIIVDVKDPAADSGFIKERISKIREAGLPILNYFSIDEFRRMVKKDRTIMIDERPIVVDGVITAVPTKYHLGILNEWAPKGVPVWIEKPIALINEVEEVRQLAEKHVNNVFGVDFFIDGDTLMWALQNERIWEEIGELKLIEGRCVESWGLENEPRAYTWLMDPELSGGGLAIDTLVHPLAMAEAVLSKKGLSLKNAKVTKVILSRYANPRTGQPPPGNETCETYGWAESKIGDIDIRVDGGKGIDTIYYGITVTGKKGSVEIFVGTESYDPYVRITRNDGTSDLYVFPGGSLGYRRTFLDFLLLLHGSNKHDGVDLGTRLSASTNTVELVGKIYEYAEKNGVNKEPYDLGERPAVPINISGRVFNGMQKKGVGLFEMDEAAAQMKKSETTTDSCI